MASADSRPTPCLLLLFHSQQINSARSRVLLLWKLTFRLTRAPVVESNLADLRGANEQVGTANFEIVLQDDVGGSSQRRPLIIEVVEVRVASMAQTETSTTGVSGHSMYMSHVSVHRPRPSSLARKLCTRCLFLSLNAASIVSVQPIL